MRKPSRFAIQLGLITAVALVGRIAFVLVARRHTPAWGDSFSYNYGANLLARGKGFIDPARYAFFGITTPSAYHPPLYTVYLALWSKLGVDSILGHRIVSCFLGAATVAVVAYIATSTFWIFIRLGLNCGSAKSAKLRVFYPGTDRPESYAGQNDPRAFPRRSRSPSRCWRCCGTGSSRRCGMRPEWARSSASRH